MGCHGLPWVAWIEWEGVGKGGKGWERVGKGGNWSELMFAVVCCGLPWFAMGCLDRVGEGQNG